MLTGSESNFRSAATAAASESMDDILHVQQELCVAWLLLTVN